MSEFLNNRNVLAVSLSTIALASGAIAVEQASAARVAPLPPAVTVDKDCVYSPIKNGYRESCDYTDQDGDRIRNVTWDRITKSTENSYSRFVYRTDTRYDEDGRGPITITKRATGTSSSAPVRK